MPSQRPFEFASQNGSGTPLGGLPLKSVFASHWPFPLMSLNGSWSAKRPALGNPEAGQPAREGPNCVSAALPAALAANGGVVTCSPTPARNPAPAALLAAPSIASAAKASREQHRLSIPLTADRNLARHGWLGRRLWARHAGAAGN